MANVAFENQRPQYYGLMGRAPFASTTIGALGSWVAVTVLAAIYAYADLYIKVVDKLSVLIVIAAAFAMGFAVLGILRWAKVRNLVVAALIAASSAVLALYVSWVVWESAVAARAGESLPPWWLFPQPNVVWEIARFLNEQGTFSMRDRPVNGGELWAFWAGEAAMILGCTLLVPLTFLRKLAFCEECQSWCESSGPLVRFQGGDEQTLRQRVLSKDLDHLATFDLPSADDDVFHGVELTSCPKCRMTNLLTLNRVKVGFANGERTEKAKPIINRLWLDPEQAEAVRSLPQRLLARAAEAAGAGDPENQGTPAAIPHGQAMAGAAPRFPTTLRPDPADAANRRDDDLPGPPPTPGV